MTRALGIALVVVGMSGSARAEGPPRDWLTPGQVEPLVKRLFEEERFLASAEARQDPGTLNLYFSKVEYQSLRGNPILGYWDRGDFKWTGSRVAWDGIVSAAKSAKPIGRKAWDAAFAYVVRKHGLVIEKDAPIRIAGACVAAVLEPTRREPKRGVVLEVRVQSPTGTFRLRFGTGKPTIEDAIGASLDRLVSFARNIGGEE